MIRYFLPALVVVLQGCATPPQWLANMYDSNDPCQNYYKVPNYQYPSFCGAGQRPAYITRDYYTNRPLTTTTRRGDGKNY